MELPIAMLACARIGAVIRSSCPEIADCKPKVVITCKAVKRPPKAIHLKDIVDAAINDSTQNGVSIDVCVVYENPRAMKRVDTKWKERRDI
ncbi:hypothetical protein Fmac_028860 [Flemingia macrophylla]|uniref:Uncharacterized protein n=1 Tax=Flemingia macrophylla TaxID=520843 RepID=A0ABD1L8S9_9FABA